ncbi:unnamed protein product [Cunninghamella echinulata]
MANGNTSTPNSEKIPFEPIVQNFLNDINKNPKIHTLPVDEARNVLINAQSTKINKLDVDYEDCVIEDIPVRIMRPIGNTDEKLPVVVYYHGGGWVLGNEVTHDKLIREICVKSNCAVVFINYTPSPEAKYPTAINQLYNVTKWISENGETKNIDGKRLIIAGDSVGGNMVASISILSKKNNGPNIKYQIMFYPVVDDDFETESYNEFQDGYFLTRDSMKWFWDAYLPDKSKRNEITASPLKATVEELKGLPPALIITGEADVLRDGGEKYAHKLIQAGVNVTAIRCLGIVHDFVMLHALSDSNATKTAMLIATDIIKNNI